MTGVESRPSGTPPANSAGAASFFSAVELRQWEEMYHAEDRLWWYRALRLFMFRLLPKNIPKNNSKNNSAQGVQALDLGCGNGRFLAELEKHGFKALGVDLSSAAIEYCRRSELENQVLQADAQQLPFPDGSFDFVFSLDVLETKWVDPAVIFAEITRVLRPGGYACIQAAAFQCLLSEHDQAVGSVRRFTQRSLTTLGETTGLRLIYSTYLFCLLFPVIVIYKFFTPRKSDAAEAQSAISLPSNFVNQLLFGVCKLESYLHPHLSLPFGSSVFALFQKEGQ